MQSVPGFARQPSPLSEFWEGRNYHRLRNAPAVSDSEQMEVIEFFWYACAHCKDLESHLDSWVRRDKPRHVKFTRVPVVWDDVTRLHARIYYTAQALGKTELLHPLAFREPLDDEARIADFFAAYGTDRQTFAAAFSSTALEQNLQEAIRLSETYDVDSTPLVIVNGRYRTDVVMAGGPQSLIRLIGELIAADATSAAASSQTVGVENLYAAR